MKDIKFIESYYHNNGLQKIFQYKSNLSIYDKMRFVSTVVNTLVDDNITCISLIRDLIFNFELIVFFTDIDTNAIINVDDDEEDMIAPIDLMEEFIEETDIIKVLYENIDKKIITELSKAVDDGIYYKTGVNVSDISNGIGNLLSVIENKVKEIDISDLNTFIKTVNKIDGNITPENILKAYTQSDIYKQNAVKIQNEVQRHIKKIDKAAFDAGVKKVPMK